MDCVGVFDKTKRIFKNGQKIKTLSTSLSNNFDRTKIFLLILNLSIFSTWSQLNLDSLSQLGVCTKEGYAIPGIIGTPSSKGFEIYQERGPSYQLTSNFKNLDSSATEEIRRAKSWMVKLRGPVINKDKFKLIVGLKYKHQEFAFKNSKALTNVFHQNLQDKPIRSFGLTVNTVNSFIGNKYLISRASFRLNGDIGKNDLKEHFKSSYSILLAFKKNAQKSWGFGVTYSNSFGRSSFYPLLFLDYKFKPKWIIRVLLPVNAKLIFIPNDKNIFSFNNKLEGDNYNLNFPILQPNALYLENADFKSFLTYEREIYDFAWIGVSAGFRININFDISDSDNFFERTLPPGNTNNLVIMNDIPSSPFFRVSLFLVAPRNWMEEKR